MSYLMDALRKAERERNIGRVPDAVNNEYATAYIPTRKSIHWLPILLGGLIVLNLIMLLAFWMSSRTPPPPTATEPSAPVARVAPTGNAPVANTDVAAKRTASEKPPTELEAPSPLPQERPVPADPVQQYQPPAAVQPAPEERPIFETESVPAYTSLNARQKGRIPAQTVNGHLYSSIPGRSFVLLNGRRYGEGQRTAEGPAVVFIDEEGAVLDYEGLRYRIDAPR